MRSPLPGTIDGPKVERGGVVIELIAMWGRCRVSLVRERQRVFQEGCRLTTRAFLFILGRT